MLRKLTMFLLIGSVMLNGSLAVVFGQNTDSKVSDAASVKAEVARRGVNLKKKVRVKMLDGTKRKGYISQIGDDEFTFADSKSKASSTIAYRDVKRVYGPGMPGGARVGIIVGAAAGATALVLYIAFLNAIRNN